MEEVKETKVVDGGEEKCSKITEPGSPGEEFELTAEMMVNDFDDERTLDEEEALEEVEEQQSELSNLEKEKDMPIEALLAMYGYSDGGPEGSHSSSSEEILSNQDLTLDKEEIGRELLGEQQALVREAIDESRRVAELDDSGKGIIISSEAIVVSKAVEEMEVDVEEEKEPPSMLHELYKDDPVTEASGARHLRSGSRQHSEEEEEEEEEDGDYSPEEDDWKKTIMVGADYQAAIPDSLHKYDDAMPYENEDKLLWDPSNLSDKSIKDYLIAFQSAQTDTVDGVNKIPKGSHVRDDEQALYLLLQCGQNVEEAIRRRTINSVSSTSSMSLWSEEECRNFESGLRQYGKDFHSIHLNRVRTRSVGELVQFYYLWKKTERHDVFAVKARLEKKKYILHPGTTDFMERFLDDQDSPTTSPNVHSLLSGDPKRQSKTPPPSQQSVIPESPPESVNAREATVFNNHFEDIARHLDKEELSSLVRLAATAKSTSPPVSDHSLQSLGSTATTSV